MRQGSNNQSNRRGRGRGHNHNHNRRHNNHGGNRNQNYDSNGPQGRIRGTAKQVYEKYLQLAKDAISAGDRVLAESLYQHADHYGRIAAQFAPKPKPEQDENVSSENVADSNVQEDSADNDSEDDTRREAKAVTVEIAEEAPQVSSVEEAPKPEEKAEEKPKRRAPTRRAPRKKVESDKPKLGGGSNAVPDFLARPVEVDAPAADTPEASPEAEEKPKRRTTTRRTTTRKTAAAKSDAPKTTRTRRKKADDADAGEEKEAS